MHITLRLLLAERILIKRQFSVTNKKNYDSSECSPRFVVYLFSFYLQHCSSLYFQILSTSKVQECLTEFYCKVKAVWIIKLLFQSSWCSHGAFKLVFYVQFSPLQLFCSYFSYGWLELLSSVEYENNSGCRGILPFHKSRFDSFDRHSRVRDC